MQNGGNRVKKIKQYTSPVSAVSITNTTRNERVNNLDSFGKGRVWRPQK